jgi:hypothetical protein
MDRVINWGSALFVAFTLAMLGWIKAEAVAHTPLPTWPEGPLIVASIVTLPFALAKVLREGDAKSRRNLVVLIGVCLALVMLLYVFGP